MSTLSIMVVGGNISIIVASLGHPIQYPTIDELIKIIERRNPVPDWITMELNVPGGVDVFRYTKQKEEPGTYKFSLMRASGHYAFEDEVVTYEKMLQDAIDFNNKYGARLVYKKPPPLRPLPPVPGAAAGAGGAPAAGRRRSTSSNRRSTSSKGRRSTSSKGRRSSSSNRRRHSGR